jgi:hypothetical protein
MVGAAKILIFHIAVHFRTKPVLHLSIYLTLAFWIRILDPCTIGPVDQDLDQPKWYLKAERLEILSHFYLSKFVVWIQIPIGFELSQGLDPGPVNRGRKSWSVRHGTLSIRIRLSIWFRSGSHPCTFALKIRIHSGFCESGSVTFVSFVLMY